MKTAKIINEDKSQFVILPDAFRVKGSHIFITKIGDAIILNPQKERWGSLFSSLDKFSDDFMSERVQPQLNRKDKINK